MKPAFVPFFFALFFAFAFSSLQGANGKHDWRENAACPTLTATSNSPVCAGSTLSLSATLGGNYDLSTFQWSGPGGWSSSNPMATRSPAVAGIYTASVSDFSGCTAAQTLTVSVLPVTTTVTASISPAAVCQNGLVEVSATSNSNIDEWAWQTPDGQFSDEQNTSFFALIPGDYVVTLTATPANGGCPATTTATATVHPLPDVNLTANLPICAGDDLLMETGAGANMNFVWSGPNNFSASTASATVPDMDDTKTGSYFVTITSPDGCEFVAEFDAQLSPGPAVVASSNSPICGGGTLELMADITGNFTQITWSGPGGWSSNLQNPTRSPVVPGNYIVFVQGNGSSCSTTETVAVGLLVPGFMSIQPPTNEICSGQTLQLSGPSTSAIAWLWDDGSTVRIRSIAPTATTTYSLTVTYTGGCTLSAEKTITVKPSPTLAPTANSPVCAGDPLQLTAGSTGATLFSWTGPGFASTQRDPVLSPVSLSNAGQFVVVGTAPNGCTASDTVDVQVFEKPDITEFIPTAVSCPGGSDGSIILSVAGGSQPFDFQWNEPSLNGQQNPQNLPPGFYEVTVTDAKGCFATASASVGEPAALALSCAQQSPVSLPGASDGAGTFTPNGGTPPYEASWSGPASGQLPLLGAGGAVQIPNLAEGDYTVTLTDAKGCNTTCSFSIGSPGCAGFGPLDLSATNVRCNGGPDGSLSANAPGGAAPFSFAWVGPTSGQLPPQATASATIPDLPAGNYTVTLTDAAGCTATANATILEPNPLIFNVLQNTPADAGLSNGSATASFSGGTADYVIAWSGNSSGQLNPPSGSGQANLPNLFSGSYAATLTDANGCTAVQTFDVQENTPGCTLAGAAVSAQNVACFGQSNGSATLSFTGGEAPFSFVWKNAAGATVGTAQSVAGLAAGQYFATVTDALGCEISASASITQPPSITPTNLSETICAGQNINFCGIDRDQPGTFSCNLTAAGGCDSVVTLNLQVLPSIQTNISQTICNGQSVNFCGIDRDQPGTFSCNLTAAGGCDSVVTLNLQVLPSIQTNISQTICAGQSVNFCGIDRDQTGTFTCNLTAAGGCDSVVTLNVQVLPQIQTNLSQTICAGQSVNFCGIDRDQSGTFTCNLTATGGCDSVVTLNLQVLPSIQTNISRTICAGQSVNFCGIDRDQSGTFTCNLTATGGCDSVVTLNLQVLPSIQTSISRTICAGQSVNFCGIDQNQSGTFTCNLTATSGCDSTVTLILQVLPQIQTSISRTICAGQSVNFCGIDRDQTGIFTCNLTAAGGCDSVVTLNLQVLPSIQTSLSQTICAGQNINFCGIDRDQPGTFSCNLTAAGGCDSTVTLILQVLPQIQTSVSQTICDGQSVNFCGTDRDQTGTFTCNLTATGGCDSTVTLILQVLPSIQTSISQTICAGQSVNFCGIDRDQSGTFTCNLTATSGCDSTVTLILQVLPQIQTSISRTICAGQSLNFCGIDHDQSGTFTCNLAAAGGCDSVVTLNLQVLPSIQTSVSRTICAGQSVNFCGIDRDQMGTFSCNLTATGGCDSVVTLNLQVLPSIQTLISRTICAGQSVNFCGIDRDQSGTFTCNLTATGGCDSVVTLNLQVLPAPTASIFSETVCAGGCVVFGGLPRCTTGAFLDTLRSAAGCDSLYQILNLTVLPLPVSRDTVRICAGEATIFCGQKIYDAGTFDCTFQMPNGCDSLAQRTVEVRPRPVLAAADDAATLPTGVPELPINVSENDTPPADGTWFLTIVRQPVSGAIGQDTSGGLLFVRQDEQFSGLDSVLYALCSGVCAEVCDSAWVLLFVQNSNLDDLEKSIHNVITPGGSPGQNDVFDPVGYLLARDFAVDFAELSVFNRWGELLFFEKGDRPTWDGRDAQGRIVPQATYYFALQTETGTEKRVFKGPLTVLR